MSLFDKIFQPLLKGAVVHNPQRMKKAQNLLSVITAAAALICALVPSLQPYLNEDVIMKLFAAYSAINMYLTTASSDKVGL
jgi:hypothetical protein